MKKAYITACIFHKLIAILFLLMISSETHAQLSESGSIRPEQEYLADSIDWLSPEHAPELVLLNSLLTRAASYGLKKEDYALPVTGIPADDIPTKNRIIHRVAVSFFEALAYGTGKPFFSYEGLVIPQCHQINNLLVAYARSHKLAALSDSLVLPVLPLLNKLNHFDSVQHSGGFHEIKVTSSKADISNRPLVEKLYQLGFLKTSASVQSAELKNAVAMAQSSFDLLADRNIRSTLIAQLNVPLSTRILQCRQALNDTRWLRCLTGQEETILVNIPEAYMKVYRSGLPVLEMKMVVGKAAIPTPVFTSRIQEVVLYPYWNVPHSIATRELLPLIKLSPAFLDKGGYQVLNARGKIMDPYSINWRALGPGNFPYLIRQSTGCDNALGLLKLGFYTPFGVYLHDTPSKNSFNLHKRYFSHGCMRMEKPMELGRMILHENSIAIDTLTAKGCLTNQAPITVNAIHKMALVVWYNVASVDASGKVVFYEDVYHKFKQP